jgi:hypothetical protein
VRSIVLSIFIWLIFSDLSFASTSINSNSCSDTLTRLAQHAQQKLDQIYIKMQDLMSGKQTVEQELSEINKDKRRIKKLKKELLGLTNEIKFNQQLENANRYILTMIRQLPIQNEMDAEKQLIEINAALKILDKNKLPKIEQLKKIPDESIAADMQAVYNRNVSSLCRITKSPDGKIIANEFEDFFEYTDPSLAVHFREDDFLKCQARFIKTKKVYYLELNFILNSPKAASLYGTIDVSNPIRVDFVNSNFIYLQSINFTAGIPDKQAGNTEYHMQYKLDGDDINAIRKNEVEALTVIWTSGSDRYEICRMDLLSKQFECLRERTLLN